MARSILTDAFFDSFDASVGATDEAMTLPPACYTNPEFFEFEKDSLFFREWLCVGRESWAKNPGDYFTSMHAGEPILVVRNRDGDLKAFSSVCRHRAALVAEGCGTLKSFLCPYHHWTYSLDGELIGAPEMQRAVGFDRQRYCLPRFRLEVWQGFVFVNFDPDALPLAPRLRNVAEPLANFRIAALDGPRPGPPTAYPWNWKVMFENSNDGYHANRLHKGPLHDFVPSALASFPEIPPGEAGYYRLNGTTHPDVGFNATQRALLPMFPGLSEADRNRVVFANVPPTLALFTLSDMVGYLIMHARSANCQALTLGVLVAPGAEKNPLFQELLDANNRAIAAIVAQDWHVDGLVQTGLESQFAPRGRYSWQEGAQRALNLWLVERYRAEWARRSAALPNAAE
jgi:phenylpropionate dioxygenase-like ring-hydroxylating dioxygenase large terminal subunit